MIYCLYNHRHITQSRFQFGGWDSSSIYHETDDDDDAITQLTDIQAVSHQCLAPGWLTATKIFFAILQFSDENGQFCKVLETWSARASSSCPEGGVERGQDAERSQSGGEGQAQREDGEERRGEGGEGKEDS